MKIAVVLSPAALPVAHLVQALQELGVWATDFSSTTEARAWLYDDSAAPPGWLKPPRTAA